MSTRAEQKAATREAIIDAALELSKSAPVSAIGVRELTRQAGIAPASFYRHFSGVDSLIIELISQVSGELRALMRESRKRIQKDGSLIRSSVETFVKYAQKNPQLFCLLAEDRGSGPDYLKQAIRDVKKVFVDELADDLKKNVRPDDHKERSEQFVLDAADIMVNQVFNKGIDMLSAKKADHPLLKDQLMRQLNLVWYGG